MFELTQTAELGHWQGDVVDRAWPAFLSDVKRFAAKEAAPAAPASATTLAAPTVEETLKPGQCGSAPSLAVLPFTNRSGLPEDEVFAEGVVEDVISALSQGVNVRVLGSTATAMPDRAAVTDIAALGRQLGVRYLPEAATGEIVWTGKFDRPLSELAELQEELVTDMAGALDTRVYALEMERALRKPGDITAWQAVARSISAYRKLDDATHLYGIEEARRAIAIAPDFAPGHAVLAAALSARYLASRGDPTKVQRIRAIAERALALAPDDASVLGLAGVALCLVGTPGVGERHTRRAVGKAPGTGITHYYHGVACVMLNRLEEALSHLKTAERLSPGWHMLWVVKAWQSVAYRDLGRLSEAETARDQSISLDPSDVHNQIDKAVLCVRLGRGAEANAHIEAARKAGWDLTQAERLWRRLTPNSPRLEADIAIVRGLYAATEPGV